MKKLVMLLMLLALAFPVYAQIDVDGDNNNDVDEAYGGTNVSSLASIVNPVTGRIGVTNDSDGITVSAAEACGYLIVESGDTQTVTLPELTGATTTGYNICVLCDGADGSATVRIAPNAADYLEMDGTTAAAGEYIYNSSDEKGDFACLIAIDATTWVFFGKQGTWVEQTPP